MIERQIPKLSLSIVQFLIRSYKYRNKKGYPDAKTLKSENFTEADYLAAIEDLELDFEKTLIKTLEHLDIMAFQKIDRKSLPYQREVVTKVIGSSYLNSAFEFPRVARKIAQELLKEDIHKIRFYLHIDISGGNNILTDMFGVVEYKFRYFIHY